MKYILLILTSILIASCSEPKEITAYNQEKVDWLPNTVSDINYYEKTGFGWIKVYNCKFPKTDFKQYAKQEGWKLKPEKNKIFSQHKILLNPIKIENALIYLDVKSNNGGTRVTYDVDNERLYVLMSHR